MRYLSPRLGLLLVLPVLAGCGPRTGHVTGKVTYKGAPVPAGFITFRPADPSQNSVPVELDAEGNFAVDLPVGEVTVTIDNHEWAPREGPNQGMPHGVPPGLPLSPEIQAKLGPPRSAAPSKDVENRRAPRPGKYVEIPAKYYQGETSGIKFTVKGGAQTETIELTD
jgi:hypothetical protein